MLDAVLVQLLVESGIVSFYSRLIVFQLIFKESIGYVCKCCSRPVCDPCLPKQSLCCYFHAAASIHAKFDLAHLFSTGPFQNLSEHLVERGHHMPLSRYWVFLHVA